MCSRSPSPALSALNSCHDIFQLGVAAQRLHALAAPEPGFAVAAERGFDAASEIFVDVDLPGSGIVAFLISFENFNTTLMLNGSDAPLTITMFAKMREGSTPVLNAVSLFLMIGSGLLGVIVQRDRRTG